MNITIIPLADAYETTGDEWEKSPSSLLTSGIRAGIESFGCAKSAYHVDFLKRKAMHDHEHDASRTYLVLNEDVAADVAQGLPADCGRLVVAYFTVGISSIITGAHDITGKQKKAIGRFNYSRDGSIGCYAIGEICRSDAYSGSEVPGSLILELCVGMLADAQSIVGGRLVLVDSRESVFRALYEPFGFKRLYVKNPESVDGTPMITSYYRL